MSASTKDFDRIYGTMFSEETILALIDHYTHRGSAGLNDEFTTKRRRAVRTSTACLLQLTHFPIYIYI